MNNCSKYFTTEELHFHLWNEIYNFVYENWDNKTKDVPFLTILKEKIMQEFKYKGIVYDYKDINNDCFLCEEYPCHNCPLKRAYKCYCVAEDGYYHLVLNYFGNYCLDESKEDKEEVLLAIAKVRDCYSYLNGDC